MGDVLWNLAYALQLQERGTVNATSMVHTHAPEIVAGVGSSNADGSISVTGTNQVFSQLMTNDGRLTGSLPSYSSCKFLSTLDVLNNRLSGDIPIGFIPSNLKFLDLSGNNFTGKFQNLDFGTCLNLTMINLARNDLLGTGFPKLLMKYTAAPNSSDGLQGLSISVKKIAM
ncbi:receptor-like protein kinase BRI1-like protein 3 [Tanacetum coccineum]